MANSSLATYFQNKAQQQNFLISNTQQNTIHQLSELSDLLCLNKKIKNPPCYYFWGPVGRGKSWLLNTFFDGIPIKEKKRFHFHRFFKLLHQKIFQYTQHTNPTKEAIDDLLGNSTLVCFDELHVHDIGDAMLITQLFKILFERNIAIITTSNYEPDSLLSNPLYHERFIPAITLLKKHMHIINIAGEIDFRSLPQKNKQGFTAGYYVYPATQEQRQALGIPTYTDKTQPIQLTNRQLYPTSYTNKQIIFNFENICEQETSTNDYLTLIEQFDDWIIDNVPLIKTTSLGAQQRFINLVDILYDQNKCLYLLSQYSLDQLLAEAAIGDMARTYSRLNQLQKC